MTHLLTILAFAGLTMWGVGCADADYGTGSGAAADTLTDDAPAGGMNPTEAGSVTRDGGPTGLVLPPLPADEAGSTIESE